MNNIEISTIFEKINKRDMYFIGVFPCDLLPREKLRKLPCSLIINLSPSNEIGSHWTSIFIDKTRTGHYFDSFGVKPFNKDIKKFLNKQCVKYTWSSKELQSSNSSLCGAYAICFIVFMMLNPFSKAENFGQLFSSNQFINDLCIQSNIQEIKQQKFII
jgi:hypothetical protein